MAVEESPASAPPQTSPTPSPPKDPKSKPKHIQFHPSCKISKSTYALSASETEHYSSNIHDHLRLLLKISAILCSVALPITIITAGIYYNTAGWKKELSSSVPHNGTDIVEGHVGSIDRRSAPPSTPTCGESTTTKDAYNLPLHIAAVFIILTASTLACAFPLLAVRYPRLRIPGGFLFATRHFGTGVLLGTAFLHLLTEAFENLGSECLRGMWVGRLKGLPGVVVLVAVLGVVGVEMGFSSGGGGCASVQTLEQKGDRKDKDDEPQEEDIEAGVTGTKNAAEGEGQVQVQVKQDERRVHAEDPEAGNISQVGEEQKHKKEILQVTLLEAGILFHGIFIGLALGVTSGTGYIAFLLAMIFHQTFEGLALGSRIAVLPWPKSSLRPWIMVLLFGVVTPLTQTLSLPLQTLYTPTSPTGLLLTGLFNAISAGILIFASLVELLAEDFLSEGSWQTLRRWRGWRGRGVAWVLVLGGVGAMTGLRAFD